MISEYGGTFFINGNAFNHGDSFKVMICLFIFHLTEQNDWSWLVDLLGTPVIIDGHTAAEQRRWAFQFT